jgi:hypothetical protein
MDFNDKVSNIIKKIPKGEALSDRDAVERPENYRAWRLVGGILPKKYNSAKIINKLKLK